MQIKPKIFHRNAVSVSWVVKCPKCEKEYIFRDKFYVEELISGRLGGYTWTCECGYGECLTKKYTDNREQEIL